MAGGTPASTSDDPRILKGERLWRLLPDHWYTETPPGTGLKRIALDAFLDEVSLVRTALVNEIHVDAVKGGKFKKWGIVQLTEDEIRNVANCWLVITPDLDWPTDAHVLIYRHHQTVSKRLRLSHPEPLKLHSLANDGRGLFRPIKP
jgi:hypothetical protein